jgi:hypothetical protein
MKYIDPTYVPQFMFAVGSHAALGRAVLCCTSLTPMILATGHACCSPAVPDAVVAVCHAGQVHDPSHPHHLD